MGSDEDAPLPGALAVVALCAIGLGLGLRLWGLGARGLWWDELYSVVGASTSPTVGAMWRDWMVDDSHPAGFQLLMWAWLRAVPATEWWARLPSALAGGLTLVYAAFGTRGTLCPTARTLLTSLLAFGFLPVYYAQEARSYALLALACLVVGDLALRLTRQDRPALWAALVVAALVASYLHYYGLFVSGGWFGVLALRQRWRAWLAAVAGFGLGYLPGLWTFAHLLATSNGMWQERPSPAAFLSELFGGMLLREPGPSLGLLAAMGGLALLGSGLRARREQPGVLIWLGAFLAACTVVVALADRAAPVLQVRFYVSFVPAALTALAVGLAWLLQPARLGLRVLVAILPASALLVWVPWYEGEYAKQGWREAAGWVRENHREGDVVAVLGPDEASTAGELLAAGRYEAFFWGRNCDFFAYYLRRQGAPEVADALSCLPNGSASAPESPPRRLVLLGGHHLELSPELRRALRERYTDDRTVRYKSTRVYVFEALRYGPTRE